MLNAAQLKLLPKNKPKKAASYSQAVELQDRLLRASLKLAEDIEKVKDREIRGRIAVSLAQVARGWDCLEERKRILKNKPKMGNIDPNSIKPKKKWGVKGVVAFSENADVPSGVVEEKKKVDSA